MFYYTFPFEKSQNMKKGTYSNPLSLLRLLQILSLHLKLKYMTHVLCTTVQNTAEYLQAPIIPSNANFIEHIEFLRTLK